MSSSELIKDRFQGILPALVTPMDENGEFAPEVFERLLKHVYEAGSHGVYVCGQTGEGLLQSVAIRQQVAEVAVRCSPRRNCDRTGYGLFNCAGTIAGGVAAAAAGALKAPVVLGGMMVAAGLLFVVPAALLFGLEIPGVGSQGK